MPGLSVVGGQKTTTGTGSLCPRITLSSSGLCSKEVSTPTKLSHQPQKVVFK